MNRTATLAQPAHLQRLASYARLASKRRGLTAGELAEDMADTLAITGAHDVPHRAGAEDLGLARLFLEAVAAAFAGSRHRIHITCDRDLRLSAAELTPVGMIVSEAISNALTHAFPEGRDGDIWLRLSEADGRVTLAIRDNGMGMPDLDHAPDSGRGLIEALAHQLGGHARLGSANFGGAEVSVMFPHRS